MNTSKLESYSRGMTEAGTRHLSKVRPMANRVGIRSQRGLKLLELSAIVRCKADNNYTEIYTRDGQKHLVSKTLSEVASLLPGHFFVRVHQSHLVNVHAVDFVGADKVILSCQSEIPVSRRSRNVLQRVIDQITIQL